MSDIVARVAKSSRVRCTNTCYLDRINRMSNQRFFACQGTLFRSKQSFYFVEESRYSWHHFTIHEFNLTTQEYKITKVEDKTQGVLMRNKLENTTCCF